MARSKEPPGDYFMDGDGKAYRIHGPDVCSVPDAYDEIRPCCFHRPSQHAMLNWPQYLQEGDCRQTCKDGEVRWLPMTFRRCPHGLDYPDPDARLFWEGMTGRRWTATHWPCAECTGKRRR